MARSREPMVPLQPLLSCLFLQKRFYKNYSKHKIKSQDKSQDKLIKEG